MHKNLAVLLLLLAACAAPAPRAEVFSSGSPPALLVADLEGQIFDLDRLLSGGEPLALVFWQSW